MNSDKLWNQYEAVLKKHNPLGYANLQAPATEIEIKEAEQAMKVRFPKELKDAYRRHNGTKEPRWAKNPVLFANCEASWGNLKSVVDEWNTKVWVDGTSDYDPMTNADPADLQNLEIYPYWWHPKRIPIGLTNTPTAVAIDMHPGPKGTKGQLIYHSGDEFGGVLMAPGLNAWIEFQCDCFDSGRFYVHPETGIVSDKALGGRSGMGAGAYYTNKSPHH